MMIAAHFHSSDKAHLERGVKAIVQQIETGRFGLGKDAGPAAPHALAVDGSAARLGRICHE